MEARMGTRWGRTTPMMLVGFLVIGALVSMIRGNLISATMVVQGSEMAFSTSGLAGNDVGFGMTTMTRRKVTTSFGTPAYLPATMVSFSGQSATRLASHTIDNNPATYWDAAAGFGTTGPQTFVLDLGAQKSIAQFKFFQKPGTTGVNGAVKTFKVYLSDNGTRWGPALVAADMPDAGGGPHTYTRDTPRDEARYVKVVVESLWRSTQFAGLAEIQVWGNPIVAGSTLDETIPVLRGGFASGSLDGLCISQVQTFPIVGSYTIKLTAGNGTLATTPTANEIQASNAVLDVATLRAQGQSGTTNNGILFQGRSFFGLAAQDVTTTKTGGVYDTNPLAAPLGNGWYAIDADKGKLYNLKGKLYNADIGGLASLPNLSITVTKTSETTQCDAAGAAYPK